MEYPADGLPLFYKSSAVKLQGKSDYALQLADPAITKDPHFYNFLMKRAVLLLEFGQLDEAEAECGRAAKIKPNDWTDQLRSALAFGRSRTQDAWRWLEHMRGTGSLAYQSRAYNFMACFRAEPGKWGEAESLLREGLGFDSRMGIGADAEFTKRRLLAQLYLRQKRPSDTGKLCGEMLGTKPGYRDTMLVGCLLAQAGDVAGAERCLVTGLPQWPIYQYWVARLTGELALARGEARAALEWMQLASPAFITNAWPEYIVRAALAAGHPEGVRNYVGGLIENPGWFWLQTDTTGPGFVSWALSMHPGFELTKDC